MAGSVNRVYLIGNLGRDPESRTMQSGGKVVTFSVATSESWNDKASGERKERTQWHRIVVYNERLAEVAERFLQKGRKVYVEGALETRKYTDQSGQERETTEVVLRPYRGELTILDTNHKDGDAPPQREAEPQREAPPARQQAPAGRQGWEDRGTRSAPPGRGYASGRRSNDLGDDIPFSACKD